MKVQELKEILNSTSRHDDDELAIKISSPSIGRQAVNHLRSVSFGFDWDKGTTILYPEDGLVIKSDKEKLWDAAYDLLYFLKEEKGRTGKLKNGWANERARNIWKRVYEQKD